MPWTIKVVFAATLIVSALGSECGIAAKSQEQGSSCISYGSDINDDVVSLLHLSTSEIRRSQRRSVARKPEANAAFDSEEHGKIQTDVASSVSLVSDEAVNRKMQADKASSSMAMPDAGLHKKMGHNGTMHAEVVFTDFWLSALNGSGTIKSSILLALHRKVGLVTTGGKHSRAVVMMIGLIAFALCGIVGMIICTGLRTRVLASKNFARRLPPSPLPPPSTPKAPRAAIPPELCPGGGFLVPEGAVRVIRVPALPAEPDPLINFAIVSSDGQALWWGQYVSAKSPWHAARNMEYDAYISMSSEDNRELSTMVVGKPPPSRQNVEAHIKYGDGARFGIVRKSNDPLPPFARHPFELVGLAGLQIMVSGGHANREIKLLTESFEERACATAYMTGRGEAWYEVRCFEFCDMLLACQTIMGVDRVSASELRQISIRSLK